MIIDILVLIVLLISAGIAFMRGFIREVLTIAGVVGGMAAAYYGGPHFKPVMRGWFGIEEGVEPERLFGVLPYDVLADALSYGLIFIVVVGVLSFVSHSLAEFAKRTGLGAVDRSLGFLFGLVRGILLVGLMYLPIHLFVAQDTKDSWFEDTKSHVYLEKIAAGMASYLPKDVEAQANDVIEQGTQALDARERLQQIDLLKSDDEPAIRTPQGLTSPDISPDGYSEEFRDDMNQLIDEKSRVVNE